MTDLRARIKGIIQARYEGDFAPLIPKMQALLDENTGRPDWDEYFLLIAQAVSTRGECVRSQVGAVLVRDKRIVATGYNGVAAGQPSCLDGMCPRGNSGLPRSSEGGPDYTENPCIARHAEINCLLDAASNDRSVYDCTIYLTKEPCEKCQPFLDGYRLRVVWRDDTRGTTNLLEKTLPK